MAEKIVITPEDLDQESTPKPAADVARFVIPRFTVEESTRGSDAPGTLVGEDLAKPPLDTSPNTERISIPVEGGTSQEEVTVTFRR